MTDSEHDDGIAQTIQRTAARQAVAARTGAGLALGGIIAAAMLAMFSLISDDTGSPADGQADFADVRAPLCIAMVVLAVTGLVAVAACCRSTKTTVHDGAKVALLVAALVTAVAGLSAGLFVDRRGGGSAGNLAFAACVLLVIALATATVCVRALGTVSQQRRSMRVLVAILALVPIVLTGAVAVLNTGSSDDITDMTVTKLDVHAVEGAIPHRISPDTAHREPRRARAVRGEQPRDRAVGPGFFTAGFEMINADTGTVRWRLDVPDSRSLNDDELIAVADDQHGQVVVSDLRSTSDERTIAIDAETGDIRWRSAAPLTVWQHLGSPNWIITEHVLMAVSDDARVMRVFSHDDGQEAWTHDVGRDCAIAKVNTRAALVTEVRCAAGHSEFVTFDTETGDVTDRQPWAPEHFADDDDFATVAGRYRPVLGGEDGTRVVAIEERPTGRTVWSSGSGANERLSGCNGSDCLVTPESDSEQPSRIVSLTGAHPDVVLSEQTWPPQDLTWLGDQILWIDSSDGDVTELVIVDRRTGEVARVPDVGGTIAVFPGGVAASSESGIVTFEGES